MIDIVIPLGNGSKKKDLELKYALRSAEKNFSNVGKLYIVGDRPQWPIQKFRFIPYIEKNWFHFLTRNIHEKLMLACRDEDVSEVFLYMNDDHFILQPFDLLTFPYHHTGNSMWYAKGKYQTTVAQTKAYWPNEMRLNNYDTHAPMLINKRAYIDTVGTLDWKKPWGYCIKTMYCEMNCIKGEYYPDLKIRDGHKPDELEVVLQNRQYFSVADQALNPALITYLKETFPAASKYEI